MLWSSCGNRFHEYSTPLFLCETKRIARTSTSSEVLWSNPLNSRKWPLGFRLFTRVTVWKLTGADKVLGSSAPLLLYYCPVLYK